MVRSGISLDSRVVLQMPQPPVNNFGESVAGTLMFIEHTDWRVGVRLSD